MKDRYLKCIDCGHGLSEVATTEWAKIITCPCGISYSKVLLNQADLERWERVRSNRSFKRRGNELHVPQGPLL